MRLTALLAALLVTACESSTDLVASETFGASLSGGAVRPNSIQSTASGNFSVTLKSNTSVATYELSFNGLAGPATAAHIHGPAADTAVAETLINFAAPPGSGTIQLGASGTASGEFDLHSDITASVSGDSLFKLLHAGRLYVDVHTASNGGGEIRGQIKKN